MSTLAVVLIVIGVVVALFLIGGFLGARRSSELDEGVYELHLREADRALEQARASDRGWDRAVLESVVREALAASHPGVEFAELDLTLVDDRPGVEGDRAHFAARGTDAEVTVVLSRDESGWRAEPVG